MMNRLFVYIFRMLLLCGLLFPAEAFAQSRGRLKKDNAALQAKVDSLCSLLEAERKQAHERDSIAQEMLGIYEENERKSGIWLNSDEFTPEVTDSLLDIWYMHRQMTEDTSGLEYDMDSVHFTSSVSDSVLQRRLEKLNTLIALPYNETVRNYMVLYSEKMPVKMGNVMALSQYYMPIFEETFSKYGLPEELKYLSIIESALNPNAVSRVGAVGVWQFMIRTAKSYGLEVTSLVDERRDPVKSADAAARYLTDLYKLFGDWNLAVSSYNCGPGNVNKAIRRSGSRNYWDIYRYLPRETRGYVPAFVGAMYAMKYSKEYGISAGAVALPAQVDTFEINHNLHFQQISDLTGISMDELRGLNPQYVKDIIPGDSRTYILRMPYRYTASFLAHEDSVYAYKADVYLEPRTILESSTSKSGTSSAASGDRIRYKVKKGDTLGKIALKYHVTVAQLKQWNHLRSSMISIGQTLYIYGKAPSSSGTSSSSGAQASNSTARGSEYVIRKGDTLSGIASKFPGVSAKDIMEYNGIGEKIREGQKIIIPAP
ncbi:MAG: LysM peptidoglycan-binding domain-containing protein [Candidatus Cryptobacteroides sp.]